MDNPIAKYTAGQFEIAKALSEKLGEKTDPKYIEKRPDGFDYVQVGYVRRQLTKAFGLSWSFHTIPVMSVDEMLKTGHCVVKGTLTIINPKTGEAIIVREQYGGAPIKRRRSGEILDLANDLKGAGSDALKKCASTLGIAQDVYEPKVELKENAPKSTGNGPQSDVSAEKVSQGGQAPENARKAPFRSKSGGPNKPSMREIATLSKLLQDNALYSKAQEYMKKQFKTTLMTSLSVDQYHELVSWVHKHDPQEAPF